MIKKLVGCVMLLMLVTSDFLLSQNLVPNPSFECGTDICAPVSFVSEYSNYACQWTCPTEGTSDIFSTLLPNKYCYSSMPYNGAVPHFHAGNRLPRTGNRFAGIITFKPGFNYREYLQVKLKTPLILGEYYCAEMYVSTGGAENFATNNLGMYFAENETSLHDKWSDYYPLEYTPQIIEKNVINDTVNWVRISGTFKATSAFNYLIIGNFSNDLETKQLPRFIFPDNFYDLAYYFVEDVSVEHLPQKNLAYTGRTEICQGESTTLKIPGFDNVTWTTLTDTLTILSNADTLTVNPQVTTQYRVIVKNCHLTIKDTITVTVDTFLRVHLGNDTTICDGTSIELNAGALLGSVYKWQDKSSNQYLKVNKAGKYSVNVSNPFNNCVGYDEIEISIKTVPKIELGNDTLVCKDFYPLKAGEGGTRFQWSTGSTDSIFTPSKPGKYWVNVENRCGESRDSIRIYSAADIFLPNVLTLNGDKLNEEFRTLVIEDKEQNLNNNFALQGKLIIYNRWGNEIFYDNNYKKGWPPGNMDLESGVYYYTFNYLNCPAYKGWIHLIK